MFTRFWLSPDGGSGGQADPPTPPEAGKGPQVPVATPEPGKETGQAPTPTAPAAGPGASSVSDLDPRVKESLAAAGYPTTVDGLRDYVRDSQETRDQIAAAQQAKAAEEAAAAAKTVEGQLMQELLSGLTGLRDEDIWQNPKQALAIALGTALKKHTDLMGRAMMGQMNARVEAALKNSREQSEKEANYYIKNPHMLQYAQLNRELREEYGMPGGKVAELLERMHASMNPRGGNTGNPPSGGGQLPVGTYSFPPGLTPAALGIEMSGQTSTPQPEPSVWDQIEKTFQAEIAKGKTADEAEEAVLHLFPQGTDQGSRW